MTNITKNRKNNIFAIPAAATAIPPNPNAAAIIAMIKKISAQVNIIPPVGLMKTPRSRQKNVFNEGV